MKIIIPDKVKVGGHTYTVELRNDYQAMGRSSASTLKSTLKMIIDCSSYRPLSIVNENFIHELLHTIFNEIGFYWDVNKEFTTTEENLVERIAPVLFQILCDNKIQNDG